MAKAVNRVSQLTKTSHVALGSVVAGAGVMAAASAANAEMIGLEIYDINKSAKNSAFKFDLNKDGINDFIVRSKESGLDKKGFANIKGLSRKIEMPEKRAVNFDDVREPIKVLERGVGRVAVEKLDGDKTRFVERFENPGEVDGSSNFQSSGTFYTESFLEKPDFDIDKVQLFVEDGPEFIGPFSEVGDVGYIGLSLTFGEEICCIAQRAVLVDEGMELIHMGEDDEYLEGPVTFYGWAEVVRGSLTVNRVGFQTIAGAPAPIPGTPIDVPEPATLPLLALGAAGLAAMRRRKAVAA
jgi:hypothetical protein